MIPLHIVADWLEEHGPPGMAEAVRSGVLCLPRADSGFMESPDWVRISKRGYSVIEGKVAGYEQVGDFYRFLVPIYPGIRVIAEVPKVGWLPRRRELGPVELEYLPPMPPEFRQAPTEDPR